ncbi:MAG TPA: DUF4167 domain-containing protein [Sphingomicrobium sp.]
MINQRQGGRRRGRGGQRGQNLGGQPGNRQDNRQRGNAAQLLEKYKSLARDAQLAGDRVQTEYYLQYADHYFRILSESRARFEDQRRQRGDSDEEEGEEMADGAEADGGDEERQGQGRGERYGGRDRDRDRDRGPRRFREERGADQSNDEDDERSDRVNGRDDDSLPLDVLPPSIGADGPTSFAPEEPEPEPEPAPRRRTRSRKAAEGDDEVAPAA